MPDQPPPLLEQALSVEILAKPPMTETDSVLTRLVELSLSSAAEEKTRGTWVCGRTSSVDRGAQRLVLGSNSCTLGIASQHSKEAI
jgi:hypothetical protein